MSQGCIRQPRLRWWLYVALAVTLGVAGCNDGGSNDDNTADAPKETANIAPTADAGDDQNVKLDAVVLLDGSASTDDDGDMLSYAWTLAKTPDGSEASLSSDNRVKPVFNADMAGTYTARLTVNDGQADSDPDTVTIVAARDNSAPVAKAGRDQHVTTGKQVSLDGSASYDADRDSLTYAWAFSSRPSGSNASLVDANTVSPTFTPDVDGDYVVSLKVEDGRVDSTADEITVTAKANHSVPVANAGPDQNVVKNDTVTLNGSASRDADSDRLTYRWRLVTQPDGASVMIKGKDTVSPSFTPSVPGDYVVQLLVNDGNANSEPDNVAITVAKASARPIAEAGSERQVVTGDKVELDASSSRDANDDELNYDWAIVSKPKGSKVSLSGPTTVAPSFVPKVPGDYVLRLVVNDGRIESKPDHVTITVAEANVAPTANAGADDNVKTGVMVTLDGTDSTDANGDSLSYDWRVVSAPKASNTSLVNKSTAEPSFTPDADGTYVFELVVNDGAVNSKPDRVQITATTPNSTPMADAGENQVAVVGEQVTLDGRASRDADNDMLSYDWSFQSRPSDSQARLSNAATATPMFTSDVEGDYVINLQVGDGKAKSKIDNVRITAVKPGVTLQQYSDFDNEFGSPSDLPVTINSSINLTVVGSSSSSQTLGRFRLIAKGSDFTVTNLEVVDLGSNLPNGLNPRFVGLSNGQTIKKGDSVPFSLEVNYVYVNSAHIRFDFEIAETGKTFQADYTISLN